MENHIQNIELINQYINKNLTESEVSNFENKLQTDSEFNIIYQDQITFLEGLKRTQLKADIQAAKANYYKAKWIKVLIVVGAVILTSILVYTLFFKVETPQLNEENNNNSVEIISDSINIKNQLEKAIKTEQAQVETDSVKPNLVIEEIKISKEETVTTKETIVTDTEVEKQTTIITKAINQKPESSSKDLIAFYDSVKKKPQTFQIDNEKETAITCKEGTVLIIPAKSFLEEKTGRLVRGTIDLEVTEYYKLSDILLGNLTTKSDEKQLETGGMLYVAANKNRNELVLKPGSLIEYKFSSDKSKQRDMQLFLGKKTKEGVNWELENQIEPTTATHTEVVAFLTGEEEDVEVPINIVEEVPTLASCENGTNSEKRKCLNDALSKLVSKNFDTSIAEELNLTGKHRIKTSFKINKEGEVVDIQASAVNTALANEAIRVLKLIPKMKPGKQRGYNVIVPYGLPIQFTVDGSTKNNPSLITVKDKTVFEKKFEARLINKDSTKGTSSRSITSKEVSRYAFYGSKLGWINCDRFVRSSRNAINFKFKIKDANGADVKLVFKSLNSILPSKRVNDSYNFGTVSVNEDVILVAIKMIDDKLFLGIKDAKTKEITELNFDFKEVSLEQLKTELQQLNTNFN